METHTIDSGIKVRIQLASLNKTTGDVLTTFVLRYPRIILAEVGTHRALSKSTSSSRAIPSRKIRESVLTDPFVPSYIGATKSGMQAGEPLTGNALTRAKALYKAARLPACGAHWLMEKMGIHKQITNRLLEPWVWVEQVVSATDLDNFFKLRTHWMAEPHFQELATQMLNLRTTASLWFGGMLAGGFDRKLDCGDEIDGIQNLAILSPGEWHLPFCEDHMSEGMYNLGKIVSTARCARVSYYLKDGQKSTLEADKELYARLVGSDPKHMSPAEHPAQAMTGGRFANFVGFKQHRWDIENESMAR